MMAGHTPHYRHCEERAGTGPGQVETFTVIPAQAGIQGRATCIGPWVPAFAGTTGQGVIYLIGTSSSGVRTP
jgi:hypothetical protein